MTDVILAKTPGGALVPVDQAGVDFIARLKLGVGMKVKATKVKPNNLLFHRKIFALANFAFDSWEPLEATYKGEIVAKNFDQFRDDITILAGFYTTAMRLDGTVRVSAKSWAFDSMDDDEKERLYSEIINVVLSKILKTYTRDDLDNVVNKLLGFV